MWTSRAQTPQHYGEDLQLVKQQTTLKDGCLLVLVDSNNDLQYKRQKESGNKEITQLSARHVVRNDSETSHQLNVCVCACVRVHEAVHGQ